MKNLKGLITAIITPFLDNKLDTASLKNLLSKQLAGGVSGICANGTTGESATITDEEFEKLVDLCLQEINGKIPVMVGVGTNCTRTTVQKAKKAEELGADGLLVVVPYYNKPSQNGLYEHYKALSQEVSKPIFLYNIPGRTGISLHNDTIAKLAEFENIAGIKEGGGTQKVIELRSMVSEDFNILCGDDIDSLAYNACGANGCVSVAGNIIPAQMSKMHKLWFDGKTKEALAILDYYAKFMTSIFIEGNPVGIKYATSLVGISTSEVRLPLVQISDIHKAMLEEVMSARGML